MSSPAAFNDVTPYDIMVGYWVGTANIYDPEGAYVSSTKSHVGIYWKVPYTELHFREAAEDDDGFVGKAGDYVDPRSSGIPGLLAGSPILANFPDLRAMNYDFMVNGPYCKTAPGPVSVTGIRTRPDVYQFHVKKQEDDGNYHHVYNSHHFASPNDWQIIGPIVGKDGDVGVAIVQNFRRISFDVPKALIRRLP